MKSEVGNDCGDEGIDRARVREIESGQANCTVGNGSGAAAALAAAAVAIICL